MPKLCPQGRTLSPLEGSLGAKSAELRMQADMEILTTRFLLRDFVDSDESAFVAYQADPRMLEFYGDEAAKPGHARQLLQDFRAWAQELPRRNFQLAIVRRDEAGRLVGCCGLRGVDSAARSAELGIELAPGEWGRYGYAIEVMRALAKFGFEELRLDELYGSTVSANVRLRAWQARWERSRRGSILRRG